MILSAILFFVFLIFFVYIPSKSVFTLFSKKNIAQDAVSDLCLNFTVGASIFILLSGIIRYLNVTFFAIYLVPIVSLLSIIKSGRKYRMFQLDKKSLLVLFLIIFFALVQSFPLLKGGNAVLGGIWFPSVHDNLWNIAVINELILNFPPDNPAIAGFTLKNHHYLYHFFLAEISKVMKINIYDLYFRLGPVFVSFLFGSSLYLISHLFTKKLGFKTLTVFFGIFSGNFAFIAPLFIKSVTDWKGSLFFADQPFDQIFNPYTVMGFSIFIASIYSLKKYLNEEKINYLWLAVTSLLIGISIGIKSFGGIILIASISVLTFLSLFTSGKRKMIPVLFFSMLVFLPVFLLISDPGKVSMVFAPGWLLREMMIGSDKLNLPQYADIENFYKNSENYLGLFKIKAIELAIYLLGNLGVRILGFFFLIKALIKNYENLNEKLFHFYLFILISISLLIPLLFNLSASPFNIIQFTPYAFILLSVASVMYMEDIYNFLFKKNLKHVGVLITAFLVAFSLPVNIKNFMEKINYKGDVIETSELKFMEQLIKKNDGGLILINPEDFTMSPIYIPALTGRHVYLADIGYSVQTGIDTSRRVFQIENFFNNGLSNIKFLKKEKISNIYSSKKYLKEFDRALLLTDNKYQIIMESEKMILLKVN